MRPFQFLWRRLFATALLFWLAVPAGHAQLDEAEPVKYPGQIVLHTQGLFTLSAADPNSLAERAALVQARLNQALLRQADGQSAAVAVRRVSGQWQLQIADQPLVTVTVYDTRQHNSSERALAEEWAASLRKALENAEAVRVHLEFNTEPDWVSYNGQGYSRTERRTEASELRSAGQIFRRNLIFLSKTETNRIPEQIYLREDDGSYAIYEKLRAPQETTP